MTAGDKIGGYRLVRLLGKGGMGEVYEALAPDGERVALKVFALNPEERRFLAERFRVEGRILARLRHPRLVRVGELGVDLARGRPLFAMELVLGPGGEPQTLEDVRRAGKVTEDLAEAWYQDLRAALAYCHSQGVVHRDVKLNNVLLNAENRAVLSDFGVSRVCDPEVRGELQVTTTFVEGETTHTRPVMGTYWYLAPELREGAAATAASDWYALGVAIFRLLTGMWYEPGTDALDLLSPYDPKWRRRLGRLLASSPARRLPLEAAERRGSRRRGALALAAAVAIGAAVGVAAFRHAAAPAGGAAISPLVLKYDAETPLTLCRCPPGTNRHWAAHVEVTREYWLGVTPVTRRLWFHVRGEPLTAWPGGEDAPITYVTRAEMLDFCARLNARLRGRLPAGYELRLPTAAEWRLAYVTGRTTTNLSVSVSAADRAARCEVGWFGLDDGGTTNAAGMAEYYRGRGLEVPYVRKLWPEFPPEAATGTTDGWMARASEFAPVPVGLKCANALGLKDMYGNCFERLGDQVGECRRPWGRSEWGVVFKELYRGLGTKLTDPLERSGTYSPMVGMYMTPDLPGDEVWWAPYDRMPHLGFRLCLGPKLEE